ncbi:MAG: AtpZ/AtpI family protein [Promethearchaeota archaeon]|jgi:ATP synthase protein I
MIKLEPKRIKNSQKFYKEVGPYLGLGLQLALTVTILVFVGIWLDGQFDTQPILTIIFAFFGVFTGLYNFIKTVLKSGK